MQITVIDNEPRQAALVCRLLAEEGHDCMVWNDYTTLPAQLQQTHPALLIVAAGLLGQPALRSALRHDALRGLPMLLIADRRSEDRLGTGLGDGIADYIVPPLRRTELALRVRVLARRAYPARLEDSILRFGEHAFDLDARSAAVAGTPVALTRKEFDLALLLFRHLNRPLSRAYLREAVWSQESDVSSRTVDTHVARVRRKLQLQPARGLRLVPVYSYGYRLEQLGA